MYYFRAIFVKDLTPEVYDLDPELTETFEERSLDSVHMRVGNWLFSTEYPLTSRAALEPSDSCPSSEKQR